MSKQSTTIINRHDESIEINVGDWVGFKSDYEQSGQVVSIEGSGRSARVRLHDDNGFGGEYLRYATDTTVLGEDIF